MKHLTTGFVTLLVLVGAGRPAFSSTVAKVETNDGVPLTQEKPSETPSENKASPRFGFEELDFGGIRRLYAMLENDLNLSSDAAAPAEPGETDTGDINAVVVGRGIPGAAGAVNAKVKPPSPRTLSQILDTSDPPDNLPPVLASRLVEPPPATGTVYDPEAGTIHPALLVALLFLLMVSPVVIGLIYVTHKRFKASGVY